MTAWPKHLTVDKRIVSLLSASTYESFPRSLRELVSNAYDADATQVTIQLSEKEDLLAITDNGSGMTPDEFGFFLRIAGRQRSKSRTTVLKRKRIGQFGIGFLAMFPFSETVEVESTVAGSPVVFRARVPAARFCQESAKLEDLTAADVNGREHLDDRLINEHYTSLRLLHTTDLVRRYLRQHDKKKPKHSIRSLSGFERLKWELQEILPIPFSKNSTVASFVDPQPTDFTVILNGNRLVANDYVEDVLGHSDQIERVGQISFTYVIGTPWKTVKPDEARGLRVRLNRVGVGPRQFFDLGVAGRTFSRLHWLTGEINIVAGLDEAITLDRENFTASQDYDDFQEYFRSKLREQAYYVEEVDEAKRKITAQTSHSARSETAPTAEVVRQQLSRLERKGFSIKIADHADRSQRSAPAVKVDTKTRTVTITSRTKVTSDKISVAGKIWNVKFAAWDVDGDSPNGCRIVNPNTIELNRLYPLFQGTNKDLFRRLQIILAEADRISNTKRELFQKIQEFLLREFEG